MDLLEVTDNDKGEDRWHVFWVLLSGTLQNPEARVHAEGRLLAWRYESSHGRSFQCCWRLEVNVTGCNHLPSSFWRGTYRSTRFFSVPKSPSCSNLEVPGQSEQGGGIVFPGGGSLSFTVLWSEGDSMVLIQDSPWDLGACSLPFLQRGRALRRRCLLLNVKSLGHW